ncbi:MAG TPA: DUF72 domain-containing protein [Opitutaceae bacterium]|nr:DUF72 domain-containing protein [Opitutaceae bacterium]
MQIHVGCSGWFYSHWRGIFYPAHEIGTKLWFAYYANVFRTVELNASFYRWPKPATVRRWRREAPAGFRYSIKVHRSITHERKLARTGKLVAEFYALGELLGPHLGCFLFQFPPSFHFSRRRLAAILAQLRPQPPTAVEFRHRTWWRPEVFRALRAHGLTFCTVSAPRLPDTLPDGADRAYVRLHGVTRWYRHDYADEELEAWARRILGGGAREAWVYFDNDRNGHAVKNALRFRRIAAALDRSAREPRSPPATQRLQPSLG